MRSTMLNYRLESDLFNFLSNRWRFIVGAIVNLVRGQIVLIVWNKAPSIGYKIKQVELQSILPRVNVEFAEKHER